MGKLFNYTALIILIDISDDNDRIKALLEITA